MSKRTFKTYEPDQMLLLPPDLRDWLPEDHLVYFILDTLTELDLSAFYQSYTSRGGQPPYDPQMMVGLLVYGYCVGVRSSRKLEKATYEQIPFRVLTADQHPDHDTISEFRRRHLPAFESLFVQILQLCQQAGLVKLGHVSLDGSKFKANASKHKAMSYGYMDKAEKQLQQQVRDILDEAKKQDDDDDKKFGRGRRGDGLPEELKRRQDRLAKIRDAKEQLQQRAREKALKEQQRRDADNAKRIAKGQKEVKYRKEPSDQPTDKDQYNFTDPDSRIMKDGATKAFVQSYNGQLMVDEENQIIVAADVTQQSNDKQQVEPMVQQAAENLDGVKPKKLSADTGYFSESNVEFLQEEQIDAYIATGRQKHNEPQPSCPRGRIPDGCTMKERMARKLQTVNGRATYSRRKAIVEPAIGQLKHCMGFREFLLRGLALVRGELRLECSCFNLLKLFRSGWQPKAS